MNKEYIEELDEEYADLNYEELTTYKKRHKRKKKKDDTKISGHKETE